MMDQSFWCSVLKTMVIRADWLLKADGTVRIAASAILMITLSSTVVFDVSARRVRLISVALVKLKGTRGEAIVKRDNGLGCIKVPIVVLNTAAQDG